MASKEQDLSTAVFNVKQPGDSRVDIAWDTAKTTLKRFSIQLNPPGKLDEDKLIKLMVGAKKDLKFVVILVDSKTIKVEARSGSNKLEVYSVPMSAGNVKLWRDEMAMLAKNSKLVSESDLKAFNQAHPDPEKLGKLKKEVDDLTKQLNDKKKEYTDAGGKL